MHRLYYTFQKISFYIEHFVNKVNIVNTIAGRLKHYCNIFKQIGTSRKTENIPDYPYSTHTDRKRPDFLKRTKRRIINLK